tara:strand:- start:85 stop:234 length:150 start_codon:yes stop_codon:yes gene_type:complete
MEDELASFVSRSSSNMTTGRMQPSGTGHAFLGATSGGVDSEIASAIRGF